MLSRPNKKCVALRIDPNFSYASKNAEKIFWKILEEKKFFDFLYEKFFVEIFCQTFFFLNKKILHLNIRLFSEYAIMKYESSSFFEAMMLDPSLKVWIFLRWRVTKILHWKSAKRTFFNRIFCFGSSCLIVLKYTTYSISFDSEKEALSILSENQDSISLSYHFYYDFKMSSV